MPFTLLLTKKAEQQLLQLNTPSSQVRFRKVRKTLGLLELDPKYNGLNSHKYSSLSGINGEDVWESYVENRTPSAWRVFWHYGPSDGEITIVSIAAHPDEGCREMGAKSARLTRSPNKPTAFPSTDDP